MRRADRGRYRRGAALSQVIAAVAVSAGAAGVTVVVGPAMLFAEVDAAASYDAVTPGESGHALQLQKLEVLVSESAGLIATHRDGGRVRLVLWYGDSNGDGMPGSSEVLVLTHHATAGTVVAYVHESATGGGGGVPLEPSSVATAGFAERWTFRSDVEPRVVASGVDRFTVGDVGGGATSFELRWRGLHGDTDTGSFAVSLGRAGFLEGGDGGDG